MNKTIRHVLLTAIALAFAVCLGCIATQASAQVAATPPAVVATPAPATDQITDFLVAFLAKYSWTSTALAIFGALTVVYQALIAWAHQRAAATADLNDDKWIASLEGQWWFRLLDRVFYWGGYLGAKLGGRKL